MGYHFMAQLRRYYTCIGHSSEGRRKRKKRRMGCKQHRDVYGFRFQENGASLVRWELEERKEAVQYERRKGVSGEEGYEEWREREREGLCFGSQIWLLSI